MKYYPNGSICLKSKYQNGKINGKFEVWFENGSLQFSGQYKNDAREGIWYIYNIDGSIKYKLEYHGGITKDHQMDIDASDYLDVLEKNKGKIADPEKTGIIR
jgi:antitoxin component YwqK of YwqJK toxin-antitoxin module